MVGLTKQDECIWWALDLSLARNGSWARWRRRNGTNGSIWDAGLLLELILPDSNTIV